MKPHAKYLTPLLLLLVNFNGSVLAADDAALLRDMTSVIALLGLPCGKAVSATKQGDNDHLVTCQNGNRYRVYLNAAGRVVAERK